MSQLVARLACCTRAACASIALLGGAGALAEAPPPASAFARLPSIALVRLSPDGKTVAWVGDENGERLISMFDLGTQKYLRRIRTDANNTIRDLDWADNRTLLITLSVTKNLYADTSARSKFEFFRISAISTDNGAVRPLLMSGSARKYVTGANLVRLHTGQPATVIMSSFDFLETAYVMSTGSHFRGGRKDEGWVHALFVVDTNTGNGKMVETGTPFTVDWIVDGQGRPVARSEWEPANHTYQILAKRGGGWKEIFRSKTWNELRPEAVTADGTALVAVGPRDGKLNRAWRIPLDGSEVTTFFEDAVDIEYAIPDRFTGALAGFQLGGLEPTIHWVDPRMKQIQESVSRAFPGRQTDVYDRSDDYKRLIVRVEGPASPPVYYLVDLGKGTADTIGEMYPELIGASLGSREPMHYDARDGVSIPAYLTLPPGREPKNLPLVVMPHGGPRSRDDSGFDWWAQFIATRGYAVLQPQFRGSEGFGADLERAGNRQWGLAMQDDITDGVRAMVQKEIADPARVCIVGASYGGYAALAGAAFTPDLYACAASISGIADLPNMYTYIRKRAGDDSNAEADWEELVGHPYDDSLAKASPSRSVNSIRAPILLIHGTDDTVVPYIQSEAFAALLTQKGIAHKLVKLPGEDHWLSTAQSRLTMLNELDAFLAQHLKPLSQ